MKAAAGSEGKGEFQAELMGGPCSVTGRGREWCDLSYLSGVGSSGGHGAGLMCKLGDRTVRSLPPSRGEGAQGRVLTIKGHTGLCIYPLTSCHVRSIAPNLGRDYYYISIEFRILSFCGLKLTFCIHNSMFFNPSQVFYSY